MLQLGIDYFHPFKLHLNLKRWLMLNNNPHNWRQPKTQVNNNTFDIIVTLWCCAVLCLWLCHTDPYFWYHCDVLLVTIISFHKFCFYTFYIVCVAPWILTKICGRIWTLTYYPVLDLWWHCVLSRAVCRDVKKIFASLLHR